MNSGFADRRVRPFRHVATVRRSGYGGCFGCPSRIRTSVHGSKVRCPTTRRRGSASSRTKKWSGRRDSNPRPSPWQGDALPTEPLPPARFRPPNGGAESQNRTGDTAIFSRVLYQLSYLGPMANQALAARRRREDYHAPRSASKPQDRAWTVVRRIPRRSIERQMAVEKPPNRPFGVEYGTGHAPPEYGRRWRLSSPPQCRQIDLAGIRHVGGVGRPAAGACPTPARPASRHRGPTAAPPR